MTNIDAKATERAKELADHCRYCAKDRPRCADDYERQVRDIAAELRARDTEIERLKLDLQAAKAGGDK